jgi:hypothetical protein
MTAQNYRYRLYSYCTVYENDVKHEGVNKSLKQKNNNINTVYSKGMWRLIVPYRFKQHFNWSYSGSKTLI